MSSGDGSKRHKAKSPSQPKRKSILQGTGKNVVNASGDGGAATSGADEGGTTATPRRSVTFNKGAQECIPAVAPSLSTFEETDELEDEDSFHDIEEKPATAKRLSVAAVVAQKEFADSSKRRASGLTSADGDAAAESAVSQAAAAGVKGAAASAGVGASGANALSTRSNAGGLLMGGGDFLPTGLLGNMVSLAGEAGGSGMLAVRHARLIQQLILASGDDSTKAYEKWNRKRQGLATSAKPQNVYESELSAMQSDVRKTAGKIRTRRRANLVNRLQAENLSAGFGMDAQALLGIRRNSQSASRRNIQTAKEQAKTYTADERAAAAASDDKNSESSGNSGSGSSSAFTSDSEVSSSSDDDAPVPPGLGLRGSLTTTAPGASFRRTSTAALPTERKLSVDASRGLQKFFNIADAVRRSSQELKGERRPSQLRRFSGVRRFSADKPNWTARSQNRRSWSPGQQPPDIRRDSSGAVKVERTSQLVQQGQGPAVRKSSLVLRAFKKPGSAPAGTTGQEQDAVDGSDIDSQTCSRELSEEPSQDVSHGSHVEDDDDDDDDDDDENAEGEKEKLVLTDAQRMALPEVFGISKFHDQTLILGERWMEPASTLKRYHIEVADRLGLDAAKGEWNPSEVYSLTIEKLEILAQNKREGNRKRAATFIQSRWRAFRTRWPVQQVLRQRKDALKKLQIWLKKMVNRGGLRSMLVDVVSRTKAAIEIQKYARTWLVKNRIATERELFQVTYRMENLTERLYPAKERGEDQEALERERMGEEEAYTRTYEEAERVFEERVLAALKILQPKIKRFLRRKKYLRKVHEEHEKELKKEEDKLSKDTPWRSRKKRHDDDHEHRHGRQAQGRQHGRSDHQPRKGEMSGHSDPTRRTSSSDDHAVISSGLAGKALSAMEALGLTMEVETPVESAMPAQENTGKRRARSPPAKPGSPSLPPKTQGARTSTLRAGGRGGPSGERGGLAAVVVSVPRGPLRSSFRRNGRSSTAEPPATPPAVAADV